DGGGPRHELGALRQHRDGAARREAARRRGAPAAAPRERLRRRVHVRADAVGDAPRTEERRPRARVPQSPRHRDRTQRRGRQSRTQTHLSHRRGNSMSDADLKPDELLAIFAAEAAEDIDALEAGLLALENAPDDEAKRRELLRYAHTLKGNASCVGFDAFAAFAHTYEAQLENPGELDIPSLLHGIDRFRTMLADQDAGDSSPSAGLGRTHVRVGIEKQIDQLHRELQELIMRARMVTIGPLFRQYARTVRDLAAAHGKNAQLV